MKRVVALLLHIILLFGICEAASPKIVVVGAGLAGLTAAYRLEQCGFDVDVYEARSRPGGRCYTAYFADGSHEELGGKSLEDAENPVHIQALLEEFGLTIAPHTCHRINVTCFDDAIQSYQSAFVGAPEPTPALLNKLQSQIECTRSLGDLIDGFLADYPLLCRIMQKSISGYESSPSDRLACEYLNESFFGIYQSAYQASQKALEERPAYYKHSVKGGNSRLVQALVRSLRRPIHLQCPLREISEGIDGRVRLHFQDIDPVDADCLILTLPCSTLRELKVETGMIPIDQWEAICNLAYGTAAKILIPVKVDPSLADSTMNDRIYTWFNTDHTILTFWYIADAGIFNAQSEQCLQTLVKRELPLLQQIYRGVEFPSGTAPTAIQSDVLYKRPVGISWANEEFSKGSYATFGPGQFASYNARMEDHGETVRRVFRSIDSTIFFAGEHTAEVINTLEGAVQSGERVARMVKQAIIKDREKDERQPCPLKGL